MDVFPLEIKNYDCLFTNLLRNKFILVSLISLEVIQKFKKKKHQSIVVTLAYIKERRKTTVKEYTVTHEKHQASIQSRATKKGKKNKERNLGSQMLAIALSNV